MALAYVPSAGRFGSESEMIYAIRNDGTLCFWDSNRHAGIVPGLRSVVQIISSDFACLALTRDGSVYVSPNRIGLFGNHSDGFQRVELTGIASDGQPRAMQGVTMMACSRSLFLFMTPRELFFHGVHKLYNKQEQQIVEFNLQGVMVEMATPVSMVAIGDTSLLFLMHDGQLKRIRTSDFNDYDTFECPERGDRFDFVACSGETALAVTRQGQLYVLGQNDKGQLGLGGDIAVVRDPHGRAVSKQFTGEVDVRQPRRVPLGKRVRMAAAGPFQIAAVTDDGELWACGFNNHGQLGLEQRDITRFARVLGGMALTSVVVTQYQTLALARDGRVVVVRDPNPGPRRSFFEADNATRVTVLNDDAAAGGVGLFLPVPPALFRAFAAEGRHPLPADLLPGIYMRTQVASETGQAIPAASPLHRLHGHWAPGAA